ncbi:hypothetical protein J2S74_000946 [Evansella vedderi]|uniref:DUF1616 domain-containing protein n=1 Tax=Evansella vedderi TaxID=38282 RepID=A0ABT9ZQQ4_9BACI|nr:hypothetical protein [Evansella vedderi]MDQ0253574.1 hypothetical protein [Evansella vedderi]
MIKNNQVFYFSLGFFIIVLSPIGFYLLTLPNFENEITASNELFTYGVEYTSVEEDVITFRGFIENHGEEPIILYHKSLVGPITVIDDNGETLYDAVSYTTGTLDAHVSSEVKPGERHHSEIHTEVTFPVSAEKIIATYNDYAVTRSNQHERVNAGVLIIDISEIK